MKRVRSWDLKQRPPLRCFSVVMCFSVMELTSRGRLPAEHVYITETCEVYYTEKERCTVRTKQCNGKKPEDDVSFRLPDGNLQGCPGVYPVH